MVFTSFNFLLFFPAFIAVYFLTPTRFRWPVLLVASYFFYINIKPVFALLLAYITLLTYLLTRLMEKTEIESKRKTCLLINITLILLPLIFFKYFSVMNNYLINFLAIRDLKWPLPEIKLFLPIGISFYTFTTIGYIVDVYNEEIEVEKNIGILALFVSFFPLILSGPIERAKNMLPQLRALRKFDYPMVVQGLKMMLWGYFMKLVVADRIGIYVDAIYNHIGQHNGKTLLFASVLYPFQVYADLGGYSLIAIGTARILGIHVMRNFKRPFFATSMSEFWRRWHISLISWLTDYIYTPLSFAFRKFNVWGIVIALMVTFFISGIWHGAALTFVVWGIMQGVFLSAEALTNRSKALVEKKYHLNKKAWYIFLGICFTFVLFSASQIFGRAASLHGALQVYRRIFSIPGALFIGSPAYLIYSLFGLVILLFKDFRDEFMPSRFLIFESKHKFVRVMAYSSIIILILLIGVFDGGQFIYFQF